MLDDDDFEALERRGFEYEVIEESGVTNLIIKNYPLPPGFDHDTVELLLRLSAAFPDVKPDMYWVDPVIRLVSTGGFAPQSEQMEQHVGRTWQRFSRHLQDGAWRPGIDTLDTWLTMIRQLFLKDVA